MTATRTFFLIDRQGVIRKKWVIENPDTTVEAGGAVEVILLR